MRAVVLVLLLVALVPSCASAQELDVLTWNLALLPAGASDGSTWRRLPHMPGAIGRHDVLILTEAFADRPREWLLERLRGEYPHATRVVSGRNPLRQDGGVVILSRWPIEREAQVVYSRAAGVDRLAEKGAVYARVRKQGQVVHVVGTHLQSGRPDQPTRAAARAAQARQLRAFVEGLHLPADEPLLLGGDFNVDLTLAPDGAPRGELASLLATLNAALPARPLEGLRFTYDGLLNPLATDDERSHLDHVLWSRAHLAPRESAQGAHLARASAPFRVRGRDVLDLSDHHPLRATFRFGPPTTGLAGAVSGSP